MTVSNEPGYYADGKFGIRIESIVLVRDAKTPNDFGEKGFLGFETVTMYVIIFFYIFFSSFPKKKFTTKPYSFFSKKKTPFYKKKL